MVPSIVHRLVAGITAAGLLAVSLAAGAASAQVPVRTVTVTPSTGLLHLDNVSVQATGYAPGAFLGSAMCEDTVPLTLDDCDLATAWLGSADLSGAATISRPVQRFITTNDGSVDCAADGCIVAVAAVDPSFYTVDTSTLAWAPVSFLPVPHTLDIDVTLDPPAYVDADPAGAVTIPATLTCETSATVTVRFRTRQWIAGGYLRTSFSAVSTVPCTAGTPVAITSDLTGTDFGAGPMQVDIDATASSGGYARRVEEIEVSSYADAVDALVARLSDPNDVTAVSDFVATLVFRVQYNPRFARAFWAAVLAAT